MRLKKKGFLTVVFLTVSLSVFAASYTLPDQNDSLIGQVQSKLIEPSDNIIAIQKRYDVGFNAIENANPHIDPTKTFPPETTLIIPTQHILPDQPREGIVINLPEMRMYYYPPKSDSVFTYPIGIGKIGKMIPITKTTITRKMENPVWIPPADIREFNLKQGIVLPNIMPAGPDNPLGPYAIYMRVPTYLIHSTIFPESIGKRASFGCIRMYESDIKDFFPTVTKGMSVAIINSPVKVGWQNDRLYIEAHDPLQEHGDNANTTLAGMVHMINEATENSPTLIDWQLIAFIAKERDGIPHEVGIKIKEPEYAN